MDLAAKLGQKNDLYIIVLNYVSVVIDILLFIGNVRNIGNGVYATACALIGTLFEKQGKRLGITYKVCGDRDLFSLRSAHSYLTFIFYLYSL